MFTLWDEPPRDKPPWLTGLSRGLPLPWRLGLAFIRLFRLSRWAEVVYVNGLEVPAMAAAKLAGRPTVLKIVGDYAWERARNLGQTDLSVDEFQTARLSGKPALQRRLRAAYTRRADKVVTPSRYLAGLVKGWGATDSRIEVVLNGLTPIKGEPPRPSGGRSGDKVIVTAARLVNWKGGDTIIRSLNMVEHPVKLKILGDGPEKVNLETLTRQSGLADRVEFVGRVDRRGVLTAMAEADVFVLASGYEGLPHVVLEAMAVARPVVAAACGGTPEVVQDGVTGLLFPYGDDRALAGALNRILADDDLARSMGQAGQAALAEWSWSRTVDGNAAVIESLVATS